MVSRSRDALKDAMYSDFSKMRYNLARVVDTPLLLNWADETALQRAREDIIRKQQQAVYNFTNKTEDADDMQKYRDSYRKSGSGIDCRDFDLDQSFEKIYFDYFGHGYNGSPVMNRPGEAYKCPCGVSMEMDMRLAPKYCPVCKHITPLGEIEQSRVMNR